ncbi:unnamed protein product [Litomosoides sigmodontis]|uniref:CHHC U11-48K-type domain-containing protein n=1 Tax=Litomosoides sigmodontis TaxID=42156 RepID=A0A3P6SBZ4_LITSI|nr:unnamed protein product [Litomosoides sigmodontis]
MQLEKKEKKAAAAGAIVCPYSEGHPHVIRVCDVLLHLAKCRRLYYKQYGFKAELTRCKYNGCHYVLAPEAALHELTCHSRARYQECRLEMRCPPVPLQPIVYARKE